MNAHYLEVARLMARIARNVFEDGVFALKGGISLFDDYKTAPIAAGRWYLIPPEVPIPKGIALVMANHASAAGATHFTLGPAEPMSLAQFIKILTPFAGDERIKPADGVKSAART